MKVCTTCGEEKPADLFQVRKASRDGLTASCKACLKVRDAHRYQTQIRRKVLAAECSKRTKPEHKVAWAKRNPEARKAHVIVSNAVRDGKLTKKPCEVCGVSKVQAHHDDYSKPLDVRWLCPQHHGSLHRQENHHNHYGELK